MLISTGGNVSGVIELYNLQKTDVNLGKTRKRLLQIQKLLGGNKELKSAQKSVTKTQEALQELQVKQRDTELESQAIAARVQEAEEKLMSGVITNPKELEALQASVDALGRQRKSLDDSAVEDLAKLEALTNKHSEKQSALQSVESEWKIEQKSLLGEGQKLKRYYINLKQQRDAAAEEIQDSSLKRYDQIRKRKEGVAIAVLEGDSCGACHMQVPSGIVSAARSERDDFVICPTCGRILHGG